MAHTECESIKPALPTPHWGHQGGVAFSVRACTKSIEASVPEIVDTLTKTSDYPLWNKFVPRVVIKQTASGGSPAGLPAGQNDAEASRLRPGVTFVEHIDMLGNGKPSGLVRMRLEMTTQEEMTNISGTSPQADQTDSPSDVEGVRLVWVAHGFPSFLLRSERVHEIFVERGSLANGTTYICYETFSGPLASLTKLFVGKLLVKRFAQWNTECVKWTEQRKSK